MAKRAPEPQQRKPSADEMRAAIPRLRRRIEELRALDPAALKKRGDPEFESVEDKANQMLADLFGNDTKDFWRFFVRLDTAGISMGYPTPLNEVQEGYREGINEGIAKLEALIQLFEEQLSAQLSQAGIQEKTRPTAGARKVFLVHGQDEGAKQEVARFLEKLHLEPIVLHEQLNRGQTVIEKFERHAAEALFAIVLLTPDDVGHPAGHPEESKPRARQNVILELGFFVAQLGRESVVALTKGEVEIPSDLNGVIYEPMDQRGGWRFNVAREIKGAGIDVDLNLAA